MKTPFIDFPAPLIVLVGPTAVGKTEAALQLAELLGGEIVSVDSRLFYRGMDIGTAKPTPQELARVPHHLIDVADPDQVWSLTIFQEAAARAIAEIHARGRLPLLVGGTGQYVQAVIEGWVPPTQSPHPALRAALERLAAEIGADELHKKLAVLDPVAAEHIDASNVRRNVRALEVILTTGVRFSAQRGRIGSPYSLLRLGLKRPRTELYARIDARIEAMLRSGLRDEVKRLLEKGYSADLPTMSAIGYREMVAVIQGGMTEEEAVISMKRLTRVYVRRQANWFKEIDPQIRWFEAGDADVVNQMEAYVRSGEGWVLPTRCEP